MEFQQEKYHPLTQDTQHQQCRSKWWALKNLSPKGQKDGPYAYFVCLCGFICILLPTGCAFSYGILFPVLLAEFKEGKAKTGTLFIRYKPRNLSTRRTVGMYCVLCIKPFEATNGPHKCECILVEYENHLILGVANFDPCPSGKLRQTIQSLEISHRNCHGTICIPKFLDKKNPWKLETTDIPRQ